MMDQQTKPVENTPVTAVDGILLTDAAGERVRRLMEEKDLHGHALRVFISGGGCSGYQYGMALESQPRETDYRYTFDGIDLVVDPQSFMYLEGATIDYVDDLMGGGFKIENPNAVSTCGCGHSFKSGEQAGHADHGHAHNGGGCGCH